MSGIERLLSSGNVYVMSFKPLFSQKILSGEMDCEVRTLFHRLKPRDIVLIYSSRPVSAFQGILYIDYVVTGYYREIIEAIDRYCIMFDRDNRLFIERMYSRSRRKLILARIGPVIVFREEVGLDKIRKQWRNYRPPISYTKTTKQIAYHILRESKTIG